MARSSASPCRITVTEVERFLRNPLQSFSVKLLGSECRVHSDPEKSLVLCDDFELSSGKVVFENSRGRNVVMHDLWEYTSMRKSLLSKWIHLLAVANENACTEARELKHYVVSINGDDPFVKWQLEKALDWVISAVAGESYILKIDCNEALEKWAAKNIHVATDGLINTKPVWREVSFILKYRSDALFDFPYWFGFSKRTFNLYLT